MKTEATEGETEQHSSSYPRNLLRRFSGSSSVDEQPEAVGGDSDEIELTLGLSLNGSFGVDPKRTKLVRSSSIASFTMLPREKDFPVAAPLARTCSLPTENEEEHRKRKELQGLKRLEAKRKRSDKRNSRPRVAARLDEYVEGGQALVAMGKAGKFEVEPGSCSGFPGITQFGRPANGVAPLALPAWVAGSASVVSRAVDVPGCFLPTSLGSVGSQSSSSSGVSDFESRPMQGFDVSGFGSCMEAKSPSMVQSLPEHTSLKATATSSTAVVGRVTGGGEEHPLRRNTAGEMERNMMEEMPCVSTRGEGPNGRRIEGFLYKYRKGEEVRIVCVCHGSFLTPAEFVRHAGGGDVAHPLRHIVVNPSPSAFL